MMISNLISHHSNPNFLYKFDPPIPKINPNPTFYLHRKQILSHCFRASCTAESAASFNGWDDLRLRVDSNELGESNYIKKFLLSFGIDDRKYLITCILGFVVALAISRVRVSSIIVFPAAVIVFGFGFSFGFVNGGKKIKGFSSIEGKRVEKEKDESFRVLVEKLGILGEFFDGFELKIDELKSVVKRAIDDERVELSELVRYVDVLDSIGGLVFDARNVVEDCNFESEKKSNQKSSRKKKEFGSNRFDLFGFVGNFIRGHDPSKSSKRNVLRRGSAAKAIDTRGFRVDSRVPNGASSNGGRMNNLGERNEESDDTSEMEDHNVFSRSFLDNGNDRFTYQSFSFDMSSHKEYGKWCVDDGMSSSYTEFGFTKEHRESVDFGTYNDSIEDELHTRKYQPRGTISDDLLFNDYLTKANDLLKRAKECLKVGSESNDEVFVEQMLKNSANLLSQAIDMKPMSLLAIGQLGNTYLLHGELKLRTTRALRNRLFRNRLESHDLLSSGNNDPRFSRDRVASLLGTTCEECETLLVQAGRKYRTALSIDGNDLRALYNWGLALSFRAQLIADIGPEAVPDADKLFMAAIDKFDAMMSRSNVCAPEALYGWGMALQQRSRLRPNSSRDRVKLLQQAKRLYKDALDLGSNNLQVREALSSCISELNFKDV